MLGGSYLEREKENAKFSLLRASTVRYFRMAVESYQLITQEGFIAYEKSQCRLFQTCDVACSTKSSADYFVLGAFVLCPNGELLLLDILRERLEGSDQLIKYTRAISTAIKYEAGMVYHLAGSDWLNALETELLL